MAVTEHPSVALVTEGQAKSKDWTLGDGQTLSREWSGTPDKINSKFDELVAVGEAGGNIRSLAYRRRNGRATLTAGYGREDGNVDSYPDDVTMIEELYGVDIIRDIRSAPYWSTTVGTVLTDDNIAWVSECVERKYNEAQITSVGDTDSKPNWSAWSDSMKQLRFHMLHGQDSYYETGFIMRQSLYGVRTSQVQAAFTNANTVVTAPVFKTAMLALIEAFPPATGEWLLKPPQAEYLGHGKWRVTIEYHWAEAWSIIYGGTWGL